MANFNDILFSFSETTTRIWECIEQKQNLEEICSSLADEYNDDLGRIKQGVLNLVGTLLDQGIIEECKS